MRALVTVTLLSALAPQLSSQDRVSIPADSLMVVSVDGPGKLKAAFENTRIGRLLTNSRMGGLTVPLTVGIEMGIRQLEQQTGEDVELLYETLMGYEGRVTIALSLLGEGPGALNQEVPPFGLLMKASPDGTIDLESMGEDLTELIEQASEDGIQDLRFEGETYQTIMDENGGGTTLPMMIGNDLVLIAGSSLEDAISYFTGGHGQEAFEAPDSFDKSPLAVRLDLGKFLSLAIEASMAQSMAGFTAGMDPMQAMMMSQMMDDMMNAMGISSLEKVDLLLGAREDHVVMDVSLGLKPDNRGMFELFIPERAGPPAALNLVPREAPMWTVTPVRFDKAYDVLSQIVAGVGASAGLTMAQLEGMLEDSLGVRLEEDLLDHLGNAAISVNGEAYFTNVIVDQSESGICYAFALENPTAFSRSIDTMLTKMQMREAVKTDEYRGFQVHSLKLPPLLDLQYVITDQLVILGIGDDSGPLTRAILDQEARVRDGAAPGDFPEGVAERLELAPQGWAYASTLRVGTVANGIVQALIETGTLPEQMQPMAQMVLGLLKDFKLEDMVSTGAYDNDTMTMRLVW
jgi:hypothetical protein